MTWKITSSAQTVFISKLLVIEVNVFAVVYSYMSENFIRMLKLLERLV